MASSGGVCETAYYDLLQVSSDASAVEIRRAYRMAALRYHPDRAGDTPEAKDMFQRLQQVYEVLADEERRRVYDQHGEKGLSMDAIDARTVAEFFKRSKPISEEDIEAYRQQYKDSQEEREDLMHFFEKYRGNVKLVLQYIPYSEHADLERLVRIFDELIGQRKLHSSRRYTTSRKALLKLAEMPAPEAEMGEKLTSDDDETAPVKNSKTENAPKDMNSLIAMIQDKNKQREATFDTWADSLAAKYQNADDDDDGSDVDDTPPRRTTATAKRSSRTKKPQPRSATGASSKASPRNSRASKAATKKGAIKKKRTAR